MFGVDLFAGAGGLSEGFEMAGVKMIAAQELHPQPALTYSFNHPDVPVIVGDVSSLNPDVLDQLICKTYGNRKVDVVVGGPPCQGFSSAGSKKASDPRNSLFKHFCRFVAHFSPKVFVMENVPGFRNRYDGKAYREACETLSALGYNLSDNILSAFHYGVPQRRKRFFLVGIRSDLDVDFSWPVITHERFESDLFAGVRSAAVSVEQAIADLAFIRPGEEAFSCSEESKFDYSSRRRTRSGVLFNHLCTEHREKALNMFRMIPEGGTISAVPEEFRSAKKTMARLDRKSISNAVLALPDDLIHYCEDRIPTVREMARLQSFDDDYVFFGKRTSGFKERSVDVPQYTQVGNAVPPLLAKAVASSVVTAIGGKSKDVRNLKTRIARHKLVKGTSGYTGYALEPGTTKLDLYSLDGSFIQPPIDEHGLTRCVDQNGSVQWKTFRRQVRRGQWAPGVSPPDQLKSKLLQEMTA